MRKCEELFVKTYPPPQVVGSEGMFGIVYMLGILTAMYLAPGSDNGSFENAVDSLYKMKSTPKLDSFIFVYMVSIAFYNF